MDASSADEFIDDPDAIGARNDESDRAQYDGSAPATLAHLLGLSVMA